MTCLHWFILLTPQCGLNTLFLVSQFIDATSFIILPDHIDFNRRRTWAHSLFMNGAVNHEFNVKFLWKVFLNKIWGLSTCHVDNNTISSNEGGNVLSNILLFLAASFDPFCLQIQLQVVPFPFYKWPQVQDICEGNEVSCYSMKSYWFIDLVDLIRWW